ncbi:sigma-54 interaction domain-containing protein [Brevibacillus sp. NRS-1366]|uniref:sigma-54 interaction domain-containing protein n=1 Tax=Brevibacillus sp. NRS-1366 TaxID=3233899 RepID=UPI003D1D11F0
MELTTIQDKIKTIAVCVIDSVGNIQMINRQTRQLYSQDKLRQIVDLCVQGLTHFCLYDPPYEAEVIWYGNQAIIFIHDRNENALMWKEIEELQLVQHELNEVINSSFDGIVISDADGVVLYQNPANEQISGLKAQECIGRNLQDLMHEGVIDQSPTLKVLEENRAVTVIQKVVTGKNVLISGVPIRNNKGKIEKVVCNIRDLTELNKLEKEILDLEKKHEMANRELEELKGKQDVKNSIVFHSRNMEEVVDRALRVAQVNSAVLIHGESGVGKEKIVNLIHYYSDRRNQPFVKINCGAIPETLLESELFGYESGSFTGAHRKGKPGLFEIASRGTVFLDEIGDMPLHLQVKLLRVLQEYEFTRIGGIKPIQVDVRIVAATNRNLEEMIAKGKFREDLYYRLNIIPIFIPPLRERREDIIPLVFHTLNECKHKYGIHRTFSREALNSFQAHDWPGNVRELQNLVERVSLMVNSTMIEISDINRELKIGSANDHPNDGASPTKTVQALKEQIEEYEEVIIKQAIDQFSSIR